MYHASKASMISTWSTLSIHRQHEEVWVSHTSLKSSTRPALLLVPGAWHGRWAWHKVQPALAVRGWRTHLAELPTTYESRPPRKGLHDDAAAIRKQIRQIGGPIVVVAHSYGGAAVSEGAADISDVRHLVYVAAAQLDVGESLLSFASGRAPAWWMVDGELVSPGEPLEMFYADVPSVEASRAVARLRPHSVVSFSQPLTAAAWHAVPSTYIVCDRDRAFPVQLQETLAARATYVRRLRTGHAPFLAAPGQLTRLIVEAATQQ
jgi:pimeloyl-ACP methyl ester carboxylesterase